MCGRGGAEVRIDVIIYFNLVFGGEPSNNDVFRIMKHSFYDKIVKISSYL